VDRLVLKTMSVSEVDPLLLKTMTDDLPRAQISGARAACFSQLVEDNAFHPGDPGVSTVPYILVEIFLWHFRIAI
jgi:hypothetical protein